MCLNGGRQNKERTRLMLPWAKLGGEHRDVSFERVMTNVDDINYKMWKLVYPCAEVAVTDDRILRLKVFLK